MRIAKVKVNDDGLKGITVDYMKEEGKGGFTFANEYSVKYKAPVSESIRELFEFFGEHVIKICGLRDEVKDDVTVTGVLGKEDSFLISAKVRTVGDKWYAVNTPLMNAADGYDDYGRVMILIDELYKGVKKYVEDRTAIMDPRQYVMEFSQKKHVELPDFDDEAEKLEYMRTCLEKSGAIVLEQADLKAA